MRDLDSVVEIFHEKRQLQRKNGVTEMIGVNVKAARLTGVADSFLQQERDEHVFAFTSVDHVTVKAEIFDKFIALVADACDGDWLAPITIQDTVCHFVYDGPLTNRTSDICNSA